MIRTWGVWTQFGNRPWLASSACSHSPMLDLSPLFDTLPRPLPIWYPRSLPESKFLSFSRSLHCFLAYNNLQHLYLKYYLDILSFWRNSDNERSIWALNCSTATLSIPSSNHLPSEEAKTHHVLIMNCCLLRLDQDVWGTCAAEGLTDFDGSHHLKMSLSQKTQSFAT